MVFKLVDRGSCNIAFIVEGLNFTQYTHKLIRRKLISLRTLVKSIIYPLSHIELTCSIVQSVLNIGGITIGLADPCHQCDLTELSTIELERRV